MPLLPTLLLLLAAGCGAPCANALAWPDLDGDGAGAGEAVPTCDAVLDGYVDNDHDCDDGDPDSLPGGAEVCNGKDDDCNGLVDDDVGYTWFADTDGDGFGDASAAATACEVPAGHVDVADDCDDRRDDVHPGADEVCDGVDDDCDGAIDEDDDDLIGAERQWPDADGDGWGDERAAPAPRCAGATVGGDCDDGDASVHPNRADWQDGIDSNCDGNDALLRVAGHGATIRGKRGAARLLGTALTCGPLDDDPGCEVVIVGTSLRADEPAVYVFLSPVFGDAVDDDASIVLEGERDQGIAAVAVRPGGSLAATIGEGEVVVLDTLPEAGGRLQTLATSRIRGPGTPGSAFGARLLPLGDLLVVAEPAARRAGDRTGAVHLVDPVPGVADLADVARASWEGPAESAGLGTALDGLLGSDGTLDLLLGAPQAGGTAEVGRVYVVDAPETASGSFRLPDFADLALAGDDTTLEAFGAALSTGDLDGDGVDDLTVGAPRRRVDGASFGAAFVFTGVDGGSSEYGVRFDGPTPWGDAGAAVAVGDLDADGDLDLCIGGPDSSEDTPGVVYVAFGPLSDGTVDLGSEEVPLFGSLLGDQTGAVLAVGDIDGDANDDLLVGAWGAEAYDGAVYLVYGGP